MPFALTSAALLTLLLGGCDDEMDDTGPTSPDDDGDGWTVADGDCDDGDPAAHPGATDGIADGVDQDCDGGDCCWEDVDGDGYGARVVIRSADLDCSDPGESEVATDCMDESASVHPDAEEVVADGVDQDCDGGEICFEDLDGDGYGTATLLVSANTTCSDTGESPVATDCDDGDTLVHPGAAEVCNGRDDDCTGSPAPEESDADADGWMGCEGDCDDGDPSVHPGAVEAVADGVDQDCDGGDLCYEDADGDGYGSAATVASEDLDCADAGESSVSTDCGDGSVEVHPDATETCDGLDDDCDGEVDEDDALDAATWYADTDGDGYGDPGAPHISCEAPTAYVADATDCDDADPGVHPDAEEIVADGIDEDCDGSETCYLDFDRDGYGTSSLRDSSDLDCTGERESSVDTDCDDGDGGVHPGADERCDGEDDDCDGEVDEDDAVDATIWYADADGDRYGDASVTHVSCDAPSGYRALGTDCDDADATIHPRASEVCGDGIDDDCDGEDGICEICGNGIDDDEDGLVDCEDGDCAAASACGEDCDDVGDEDGDGLADCEDDECWAAGTCAVAFRVREGARVRWHHRGWVSGGHHTGSATSIDGTLRVQPLHSDSTSLAALTCAWHVDRATFEGRWWDRGLTSSGLTSTVSRTGFVLSPSCPLPDGVSTFLPVPQGGWGHVYARNRHWRTYSSREIVPSWYAGSAVRLWWYRYLSFTGVSSSWSIAPIETGNTFVTRFLP